MTNNIKKKIEVAYPEAYRLARRFHEFYEQSAPAFGYETKKETKEFDPESPNGRLMAWVCYEIVKEETDKCREDTLREVGEKIDKEFGGFLLKSWSGESEVYDEIDRLKADLLSSIKSLTTK